MPKKSRCSRGVCNDTNRLAEGSTKTIKFILAEDVCGLQLWLACGQETPVEAVAKTEVIRASSYSKAFARDIETTRRQAYSLQSLQSVFPIVYRFSHSSSKRMDAADSTGHFI